ncbi:NAD(P)H-dependent oxidoreductase [Peredibacter sp. HCB2-198]|uniref:NAD(P)H-dependent oxidoreductase n=1 Tax=Peredibacter sp. HCB2-198 TaxID=3383025 RepID=UPI0038B5953E
MNLIELLNWRYATKAMNKETVSADKVDKILEAARLTPTSSGLQQFEVIVITNQEIKDKIRAVSWNQSMVSDCSHLLVFAAWDQYTPERINGMFDLVNEERGFKNEGFEAYRQKLLSMYPQQDPEVSFQHAARQAYIALGTTMVACAELKVDSVPMEGFDPKAVDEILNLKARGLRSAVMLPIGYREAKNDWLVNLKKVRRPKEQFIVEVK